MLPYEEARTPTEIEVEKFYWGILDAESTAPTSPTADSTRLTCPAAALEDATATFGFFKSENHSVVFFSDPVPIPEVLQINNETTHPTDRMRLSAPCLTKRCVHWTAGGSCRLGHAVAAVGKEAETEIPACPIRTDCRWFAEHGDAACRACAFVHRIPFIHQGRLSATLGLDDETLSD